MSSPENMPQPRSGHEDSNLWFQSAKEKVGFDEIYSVGEEIGRLLFHSEKLKIKYNL